MVQAVCRLRRYLLICGIISSVLYVTTDILGGIMWGNYDFTAQYVSELSAIGSPSRQLVIPLYVVYNILVVAFVAGVWLLSSGKRNLQILSCLLCGYVLGGLIGLFFPMDPNEPGTAFTNAMHQTLAGVTVLFILLSLAVGASIQGKRFGLYSLGTILIYLALGSLPFLGVTQVEEGLPTPWLGFVERIMVYGYMLWIGIFSALLLRRESCLNS
ncbi:MAG: DUF998 domain-containing protein [Promethearchaeota archaeon]